MKAIAESTGYLLLSHHFGGHGVFLVTLAELPDGSATITLQKNSPFPPFPYEPLSFTIPPDATTHLVGDLTSEPPGSDPESAATAPVPRGWRWCPDCGGDFIRSLDCDTCHHDRIVKAA
jgi:hypothetical protein